MAKSFEEIIDSVDELIGLAELNKRYEGTDDQIRDDFNKSYETLVSQIKELYKENQVL